MKKSDEFALLDATEQAELVRKKEVKPIELVESAIERIERLNPKLNAVVTPMYDTASDAAKSEIPDGPFTGVPYLLKDLLAECAGIRFTEGSAFLRDFVPDQDTELVSRLKRAGLIIIGKTNTPEFGLLPTTEPRLHGPTHNPWDINRTPGGSSGGSAAAVASGLVPMANANDGGGSIRIPASCCGIFGLKPTRARNPLGPEWVDVLSGLFVAEHAVTRTVRDCAALLDTTSGPFLADPYWAPPPERPFLEEVGSDPGKLRIAFTTDSGSDIPVHEDCIKAVQKTVELCADLGHEIIEDTPVIDKEARGQFGSVWSLIPCFVIDYWAKRLGKEPSPDDFEPMTWAMYEWGKEQNATMLFNGLRAFQIVARDMIKFSSNYDVLLTPTLAEPPVPLGTFDSTLENPIQGLIRSGSFAPFTPICNITGQPAMSVPLYWNDEDIPIGSHFIGRYGDEANLFRLATQLEEAHPWKDKRPALFA
jgi:amidase